MQNEWKIKSHYCASLVLLVLIVTSCSIHEGVRTESLSDMRSQIREIVTNEVKKRERWNSFKISLLEFRDNEWHVTVVREPETPGGHRTLIIDPDGKIKKYSGGL